MFDLTDRPLHWITVEWPGLKPDESDVEGLSVPTMHKIELRVELIDRDELREWFPGVFEAPVEKASDKPAETRTDFELLKRVVRAWRKVVSGGQPVPFTDDNLRKLINVPSFCSHFGVTYINAVGGAVEIREKNLQTPPSDGRAAEASEAKTTPSPPNAASSD